MLLHADRILWSNCRDVQADLSLCCTYARSFCRFLPQLKCNVMWAASGEFGSYCLCEQRKFRRACASAQSRQNLRYSLVQAVSQEEPSDKKPDPWPLAGHAQLKFVMTECSKTQICLTRSMCWCLLQVIIKSMSMWMK